VDRAAPARAQPRSIVLGQSNIFDAQTAIPMIALEAGAEANGYSIVLPKDGRGGYRAFDL
jgi:hypothetical protein